MKYQLGLSILYGLFSKIISVFGNFILLAFITYNVNVIEQGYYYTFLSIIGIYNVLELGLSVVIRQYIALNCKDVSLFEGKLIGDLLSIDKIRSVIKKSLIFYLCLSVMYIVVCYIFKIIVFADSQDNIKWEGFWDLLIASSAISFVTLPLVAYIEGIGMVKVIQKLRLITSILVSVLSISLVVHEYTLVVPSVYFITYTIVVLMYVYISCRDDIFHAITKSQKVKFSWFKEIMPQQSKIALSWICGFFIFQIVNPIIFKFYGPEVAASYGFTMTLVNLVLTLGLMYSNLAMPQYSFYLSNNKIYEAVSLFKSIFNRSLLFVILISLLGFVVTYYCRLNSEIPYLHTISMRAVDEHLFMILLFANIFRYVVGMHASFIRSLNEEKHLYQSIILAILIGCGVPLIASILPLDFVIYYQFVIIFFFGYIYSRLIFKKHMKGLYVNNCSSNL